MLAINKQKLFKNDKIIPLIDKINSIYLHPNRKWFCAPDNSGYISEEALSRAANQDPETAIACWLMRIERYFRISSTNDTVDSKANTVLLVVNFLNDIDKLPEPIKEYLCTDDKALNCLIFSLLLSRDKSIWNATIKLITKYSAVKSVVPLLQCCADLYFNQTSDSCEQKLNNIIEAHKTNYGIEFVIPQSPVTTLLGFIISSQWYIESKGKNPSTLVSQFLPTGNWVDIITIMPYMLEQGVASQILTNDLLLLNELQSKWNADFLEQFRFKGLDAKAKYPVLYHQRFRIFLHDYIIFNLKQVEQLTKVEQLIGLSYLIKFYDPKPLGYSAHISQNATVLVNKLFSFRQHHEAYELYDNLLDFFPDSETDTRLALYCFVAKLNAWLSGTKENPEFNNEELKLIPKLTRLKDVLAQKLAFEHLYQLALDLGNKYKRNESKVISECCYEYYLKIVPLIKNELDQTQKTQLADLFKKPKNQGSLKKKAQPKKGDLNSIDTDEGIQTKSAPAPISKVGVVVETKAATSAQPTTLLDVPSTTAPLTQSLPAGEDQTMAVPVVQTKPALKDQPKQPASGRDKLNPWGLARFAPGFQPKSVSKTASKSDCTHALEDSKSIETGSSVTSEREGSIKSDSGSESGASAKSEKDTSIKSDSEPEISTKIETNTPIKSDAALGLLKGAGIISKAQSVTFFPPANKSTMSLKREQIPKQVMQLIDELQGQFPKASFYLTGAAPANIFDAIKPNDYDILVINATLADLEAFIKTKVPVTELRSPRNPILFCDTGNGITLDFSAKILVGQETVEQALQSDYYVRDFSINALYCRFTKEHEFPIFSFEDALQMRSKHIISSIRNPEIVFKQDPIRLIRLAKILINYPGYTLSTGLQNALRSLHPFWVPLLSNYVTSSEANRKRLDQAYKKLFARSSDTQINNAFKTLGVLNAFTNVALVNLFKEPGEGNQNTTVNSFK